MGSIPIARSTSSLYLLVGLGLIAGYSDGLSYRIPETIRDIKNCRFLTLSARIQYLLSSYTDVCGCGYNRSASIA